MVQNFDLILSEWIYTRIRFYQYLVKIYQFHEYIDIYITCKINEYHKE